MSHALFAQEWEVGWNGHDLDRILSHYSRDVTFYSKKAVDLVCSVVIQGKDALKVYWSVALVRQPDLKFSVVQVFEDHNMLVITYINHRGVFAAETLRFDTSGLVIDASACHAKEGTK